jgi:ATP synthase D chain, mitochondrial (ATP5H)
MLLLQESKIAAFVADSAARVALLEEEYKKLSSTLPFEQMTMEDYIEAFPEKGWNPNAPTFWPHGEEDAEGGKSDH